MEILRTKDVKHFFKAILTTCLALALLAVPLIVIAIRPPQNDGMISLYSVFLLIAILVFSGIILLAFFRYFSRQQKILNETDAAIKSFMAGGALDHLASEEEGNLSRLFSSVNLMATALNAHVETERKTQDFLRQMMEDISHQLKTPLASLKMCNEIIRSESDDEVSVRRFSENADLALAQMDILIQNLLKISRFDAGVIQLHKTTENLKSLLEEAVVCFDARSVQERKAIDLEGNADIELTCDKEWISEAIGNLVKNALDHMASDGEIRIRWQETPVGTQISVQDNGSGIHPEDIHHIFKRFYRSRFSQDTQGIGLGLSLVKSIVEAHNGTITVSSMLGKGTTFTLDFLRLTRL